MNETCWLWGIDHDDAKYGWTIKQFNSNVQNEWMNKCLKAHRHTRPFSVIKLFKEVVLCHCWRTMAKHINSIWKKKKWPRKSVAFKSKEDQGIFYRHSIHRQIHTPPPPPPFFCKVSRVPHQLRVPREVPSPITKHTSIVTSKWQNVELLHRGYIENYPIGCRIIGKQDSFISWPLKESGACF